MATTTPNLGLVKPDYEDLADVAVLNDNSDTIDAAVKAVQDSITYINDNVPANVATAETGFEVPGAGYRQFGKVVYISVAVKTLNALTANTTYTAATVASGRRPVAGVGCTQSNPYNNCPGVISTAGKLNIRPTQNVSAGTTMYYTASYMLP